MTTVLRKNVRASVLVAGLAACSAFADEATVKGVKWQYEVEGTEARILHIWQAYTGDLTVPDKIGKYRVTSIGDEAFNISPGPSSFKIPASVTCIGEYAFVNCPKLSVFYTDAGNIDRLKTLLAQQGQGEGMGKIRIEAVQEGK